MESLYTWVRNITYYLIFLTVLENLLPSRKYERYVRLFAGMILILLVIQPVLGGMNLEERLAYAFESWTFQQDSSGLDKQLEAGGKQREQTMVRRYEEAVEMDIRRMAEGLGLQVADVQVKIGADEKKDTFGQVTSIRIAAGKSGTELGDGRDQSPYYQLRKKLTEYYGLEDAYVEIQRKDP